MSDMPPKELKLELLRELLNYDEMTGVFIWKKHRSGKAKKGSVAGTITSAGYFQIHIDGKVYKAHRLAWMYINGTLPKQHIDHINGIRTDNRICNLRDVDRCTNMQNRSQSSAKNKIGILGVTKRGSKFYARRAINGISYHLGAHTTPDEASRAYKEAISTVINSAQEAS